MSAHGGHGGGSHQGGGHKGGGPEMTGIFLEIATKVPAALAFIVFGLFGLIHL